MIPGEIIAISWFVFWAYWLISAVGSRSVARVRGDRVRWVRAAIAAVIVLSVVGNIGGRLPTVTSGHAGWMGLAGGFGLFYGGLGLCVWARVHLGRSWGMPMSDVAGAELVTTGPYRYIRHPIYTGLLLGLTGTMLVSQQLEPWLVLFVVGFGLSIISARREEKLMVKKFGSTYEDYRRRSKMIVPFVL